MSESVIPERLCALRARMKEYGIDAYLIPTDDFHASEYVGDYFKCRTYMSGFTGSAGTLVVMADMAGLWVDGRYFLQASSQLEGSGIDMYKMDVEGVPTVEEFIVNSLGRGQCLGFDGRTVNMTLAESLKQQLEARGAHIAYEDDLVDMIWNDRPALPAEPVWEVGIEYTGESRADKLAAVRQTMAEKGADYCLMTALDDIAWTLNIRGNDVAYNPVVLSYMVIMKDCYLLFINERVLSPEIRSSLEADGGVILDYGQIYSWLRRMTPDRTILLDGRTTNYALRAAIPEGVTIINEMSPARLTKAAKNEVEMSHLREANLRDSVALTRFMYWIKQKADQARAAGRDTLADDNGEVLTEISAADKLESFRREQGGYMGPSFNTISGFGEHGAIIHYGATPETNCAIGLDNFYLVDSGGQYEDGTTDVTRTFVLGEVDKDHKADFTRVLRGTLALQSARFPHGVRGINLDALCRGPLWEAGLDFNHGTGHGVGFMLNCHEGPNGFRWKVVPERMDSAVFEEGMLTSDEPGLYLEGRYGIRHENLLLCRKGELTEYGQFMYFEVVTLVPFDLDGIDPDCMSSREKEMLNDYHAQVYEKISPYLPEEEQIWLKEATRPI